MQCATEPNMVYHTKCVRECVGAISIQLTLYVFLIDQTRFMCSLMRSSKYDDPFRVLGRQVKTYCSASSL